MRKQKNILIVALIIAVVILGALALMPKKGASSVNNLVSFVDSASALVKEKGTGAFPEFNDPKGKWINGDNYIFVYDMEGTTLVLPTQPKLVGTSRLATADPAGERYVRTMINILNFKNSGWNSYLYAKPGETIPSPKLSYFKLVEKDGIGYIVGSGIYLNK